MKKITVNKIFLLMLISLCAFFILDNTTSIKYALAFTLKNSGQFFTHEDWNNLPNDFIDKSGDIMQGNLNMGSMGINNLPPSPVDNNEIANKQYVDNTVGNSGAAEDIYGQYFKIVCDSTMPGFTAWTPVTWNSIRVFIDTSGAAFSNTPLYWTSLGGNTRHYTTIGATSIIDPSASGFFIYLIYTNGSIDPATANSRNWHINWCGIGN